MKNNIKGNTFLILAAFVWGCGLVAQKAGMNYIGPAAFTCIRCFMGGLSMVPVVWVMEKNKSEEQKEKEKNKYKKKDAIVAAVACGILVAILMLLQQFGIPYTTVGKAGFITALYILIIPILGLFRGKKVGSKIWIGVAIALAGLYLLSLTGGFGHINFGDMMMLFTAIVCSMHLHVIDHFVQKVDPVKLSCYQFIVVGIICLPITVITETLTWQAVWDCAIPLLYAGFCSCAIGYTFQIIGQKYTEPNKACLLMSLESVFTLLSGFVFFGEILSGREYVGCALVFVAIIISQLPDRKTDETVLGAAEEEGE